MFDTFSRQELFDLTDTRSPSGWEFRMSVWQWKHADAQACSYRIEGIGRGWPQIKW